MSLEKMLSILRKNREEIPKEQLHTKYAKAYDKLLHDIKDSAESEVNTLLKMQCTLVQAECIKVEFKERNIQKKLSEALFKSMDYKKFCGIKEEMKGIVARYVKIAA